MAFAWSMKRRPHICTSIRLKSRFCRQAPAFALWTVAVAGRPLPRQLLRLPRWSWGRSYLPLRDDQTNSFLPSELGLRVRSSLAAAGRLSTPTGRGSRLPSLRSPLRRVTDTASLSDQRGLAHRRTNTHPARSIHPFDLHVLVRQKMSFRHPHDATSQIVLTSESFASALRSAP